MTNEPKAYYLTDAQVEMIDRLIASDSRMRVHSKLDHEQRLEISEALGIDTSEWVDFDEHIRDYEDDIRSQISR